MIISSKEERKEKKQQHYQRKCRWLLLQREIIKYQILTKIPLFIFITLFQSLIAFLMFSTGRAAITSSDFTFLFTTWQGWLIILITFAAACLYFTFDVNTKILYAYNFIQGKAISTLEVFKTAFRRSRRFLNIRGLLILLFASLMVPLAGFGFSISMTDHFYIPNFVTEVVYESVPYTLLYLGILAVFILIVAFEIYVIPITLLEDCSIREAGIKSRAMIRKNGLRIYWKLLKYVVLSHLLPILTGMILIGLIPFCIAEIFSAQPEAARFWRIAGTLCIVIYIVYRLMLMGPCCIVRLLELYAEYEQLPIRSADYRPPKLRFAIYPVLALCIAFLSLGGTYAFDEIFPRESSVEIIAHRGGGDLDCENSLEGLEKAIDRGVYGSEIDIQRTKDGHYIVLHDKSFKRLCHINKSPSEMTLDEILALKADDGTHSPVGIATLDEMIDAVKGRAKLYIELKGSTADRKMADDIIDMVMEKDASENVALISLKYNLVDYIETKAPELETGLLYYASWGNDNGLNVDDLIMEEAVASDYTINSIHEQGKKAIVWTVDKNSSIQHFLMSGCDAVITNRVDEVIEAKAELARRDDMQLIFDQLFCLISH